MDLDAILTAAFQSGVSDIHFKSGLPPLVRINGSLYRMSGAEAVDGAELGQKLLSLMNERQRERYLTTCEVDLAYVVPGVARFRLNAFQQRGLPGAVFRVIPCQVASLDQLGLPPVVNEIAREERGLVLVTGTTGCGKSTTMAAMIEQINQERTAHILTIEEPIEYLLQDKCSLINQREIGLDTMNYAAALKSALRQDPDVIFIGEMRDLETIEIAMTAAETGHLVLSTLHTLDVVETVNRIVAVFPPHQQKQIRIQLGTVLKAVICQRLVRTADDKGRIPAVEVMRMTSRIREMVDNPERTREISDAIQDGFDQYGMQTFDQSLMQLLTTGRITYDEALRQAAHPDNFALRYSGIRSESNDKWRNFDAHKNEPFPAEESSETENYENIFKQGMKTPPVFEDGQIVLGSKVET